MRYRVRPVIQAYTLAALRGQPRTTTADSAAREQLTREILRYGRGESGGRAVLVSGEPGVGKTSLVLEAVQRAREGLAADGLHPLLVYLDAPSLLMPAGRDAEPATGTRQLYADVEMVLRRAAVGLFQAMEEEIWRAMLSRATQGVGPRGVPTEELVELATRLRAEMSQAPTLQDLRDLWRRAGLLDSGGLFGRPDDAGHGVREVLALWSALRAYHVASDTVVGESAHDTEQAHSAETRLQSKWSMRETLNPLVGLLSGVLVGASVLQTSGLLAALLGSATAILTGAVLDLSVRQFSQESQKLTYKVTLDTTPYALTRLLPALVTHLRETGLAPVFVVDELDKVKDQRHRLDALMSNLKAFVAEDAFFCFLTDRDYYEMLRLGGDQRPASYSDHLFVCYRPAELRTWLAQILEPDRGLSTPAERKERDLLVTGLLGRTRMQLGDLHRRLRALSNLEGELDLPEGGVTNSRLWRVHAYYQAALERALRTPRLDEGLRDDTYALQMALDVLFWPANLWERGEALRLEPALIQAEAERHVDLSSLGVSAEQTPKLPGPTLLALTEALAALAAALADPGLLADRSELADLGLEPLLARDSQDPRLFHWRLDPWGHAMA